MYDTQHSINDNNDSSFLIQDYDDIKQSNIIEKKIKRKRDGIRTV